MSGLLFASIHGMVNSLKALPYLLKGASRDVYYPRIGSKVALALSFAGLPRADLARVILFLIQLSCVRHLSKAFRQLLSQIFLARWFRVNPRKNYISISLLDKGIAPATNIFH